MQADSAEGAGEDDCTARAGHTWQEGFAMKLVSNIFTSSGATSEVEAARRHENADSMVKAARVDKSDAVELTGEMEHLVTGKVGYALFAFVIRQVELILSAPSSGVDQGL